MNNIKKNLFIKVSLGIVIFAACIFAVFIAYRIRREAFPVTAKVFEAPKPSNTSWEQVFKSPSPVKIERLNTGIIQIKKSSVPSLKHPDEKGTADESIKLKILSYLIHHERFGNYLVDAGLDTSIQENLYGNLKDISGIEIVYTQKKEMKVASQLKKKNIIPKGIFLTHLHYDNTSGLFEFPSNIECYLEKNETYINNKFIHKNEFLKKFNNLNQFDFTKAQIMEPLGPALDIFGDGSLWAVSIPGYTETNVSYLINGQQGPVLIIGDPSIVKYGVEFGMGPGTFSGNIKYAQTTFKVILKFKEIYPQVNLAFGHEM